MEENKIDDRGNGSGNEENKPEEAENDLLELQILALARA